MRFKNIREIDWLHLRLQKFDKLTHAITGNGNQVKLLKLDLKKS